MINNNIIRIDKIENYIKLNLFDVNKKNKNIEVLPVYRSPKINCLCPLPTGNILSINLNPLIKESLTFPLKAILQPLFKRLFDPKETWIKIPTQP